MRGRWSKAGSGSEIPYILKVIFRSSINKNTDIIKDGEIQKDRKQLML